MINKFFWFSTFNSSRIVTLIKSVLSFITVLGPSYILSKIDGQKIKMIVIIMLIAIIFDSLIYFMLSNIYDGKISCRREFNQLLKIFFYKQNADKNVEDVKETSIKEINLK